MKENNLDTHVSAYNKSFKYELDNKLMLNWYAKRVISKLGKGNLLELGVGHGYSSRKFSEVLGDYTILEGSSAVIEQFYNSNTDLNHVKIIETYFEDFHTNDKFDNIVMGFVLEHVNNPKDILKKYKNMLSKTGRLFVSVPNATSLHRQLANIAGILPDMLRLSDADIELGHLRYFTPESLKSLVESCGYEVLSIEGLFLKPFTTSQLLSLELDDAIFEALMEKGIEYPELSTGLLLEATIR